MNYFMKEALKEAKKAYIKGEIPVGAVIVFNDKIISRAHNLRETKNNAIKHAEIIAIEKACKKLKNWRLNDCIIYTTLEPCIMCFGAILQSRIKTINYGAKNTLFNTKKYSIDNNIKIEINPSILEEESNQIIKKFFDLKR